MSTFQFARGPMYDPAAVKPMRDELVAVGIRELLTPADVEDAMAKPGTTLVVVNSVCGCAAGNARPGVMLALQHKVIPDHMTTVFAGMERDAVDSARAHMRGIPPSSPCIVLFKDGQPAFALQRHDIEVRTAGQVAQSLMEAFDKYCSRPGPSISPEEFQKIVPFAACGSTIPRA